MEDDLKDFMDGLGSSEEYEYHWWGKTPKTQCTPPPKQKCFCAEFNRKRKEEYKKYEEEYQNWLVTLSTTQERYDALKAKEMFYYKRCDACNPPAGLCA